jgi:two-component system, chemotaxis family, protein-glutamate methylesterase/glutaminase
MPHPATQLHFDIVVLAGSAGGLDALTEVLSSLPSDFPIPVAVVLHRSTQGPNLLADVLSRHTALRVTQARAGERLRSGAVYLAPSDLHLSVTPAHIFALTGGGRQSYVLSSADPLFLSVARVYAERVVAVVLSGYGHDGAEGARAVGRAGGTVLVQDEATAQAFGMPSAAIETGEVDAVLSLSAIGPALVQLAITGQLKRNGI